MVSAVCCGVWLELSNQKPIRGVVCILLNTNSMYTERYKEWEGFRRSWHCRKIQKFRFSHNAYPVSYTHLDVYKRQMFLREITHTVNAFNDMADIVRPVSYTHLDVYKRQGLHNRT